MTQVRKTCTIKCNKVTWFEKDEREKIEREKVRKSERRKL